MVSTGVAVALSNQRTGRGYLGFFTTDSVLQFRGMVRTALGEAAKPGDVLMWFSGAAYVPAHHDYAADLNAEALSLRRLVARRLNDAGFALAEGSWLQVGKCFTMALRCGSNQCLIHVMDDPYPR